MRKNIESNGEAIFLFWRQFHTGSQMQSAAMSHDYAKDAI